jgi:hypothetical protein
MPQFRLLNRYMLPAETIAMINPLTPELNPSTQRCLPRFFIGLLIFKGPTAVRVYQSLDVKGLKLL